MIYCDILAVKSNLIKVEKDLLCSSRLLHLKYKGSLIIPMNFQKSTNIFKRMASTSSSKVAALANIFQQDQGGKDGLQDGSGDNKSEGSLRIFKNSINLKRTSSQV